MSKLFAQRNVAFTLVFAVAAGFTTGCAQLSSSDSLTTRAAAVAPTPLLYIANAFAPSVTEFPFTANGNVAPVREIFGSHTWMGQGLAGIAVDSTGITYVSAVDGGILEYAAGANGDVSPIREITAATNGPVNGFELAVDSANNLYVANGTDIKVFAPGGHGVAPPLRDIGGPATTIGFVQGVAVDRAGRLYAGDLANVAILVFAAGANGNVAPIARIAGTKTTLASPRYIGVSPAGNMYVSDETEVQVFVADANGNVAPARTITFNGPNGPYGNVAIAHSNAFLGEFHESAPWSVDAYRAGLHGGSNPLRIVVGSKTQLAEPVGAAVR
jgi:hypothetical protein